MSAVISSPALLTLKFIFVVVSFFLFLHSIYLLRRIGMIGDKVAFYKEALGKKLPPLRKDELQVAWASVQARMSAMREADWKLAIIEADKLLDEVFKRMGYKGKDMGERLKQMTQDQLSTLNDVWKAHKARNLLSHDMTYHISFSEAQWVIQTYEDTLKELQILD